MKLTMDKAGRIVLPKSLRDSLGMTDGGSFDVSIYGEGVQLIPGGRTAQLAEVHGQLVFTSDTVVTDDDVFALIDMIRK